VWADDGDCGYDGHVLPLANSHGALVRVQPPQPPSFYITSRAMCVCESSGRHVLVDWAPGPSCSERGDSS
jgi:hypothetical protein